MKRGAVLALLAIAASGCTSEPLEFADWTIPVPEGTRIIEYAAILDEERTESIVLERDLVIGENPEDSDATFFRPRDVAVDGQGRIYVLDQGNHRVQVFDRQGGFLRTIGREGQGPGELEYPVALAVGDGRLVVADSRNARLSVWALDGAHVADPSIERSRLSTRRLALFPDASVLVTYRQSVSRVEATSTVARVWWEGGDERTFVDVRAIVRIPYQEARGADGIAIESPQPTFAMVPSGDFYVTGADEYQVLAMTRSGGVRWALRVAQQKARFSEEYIEDFIEMLRQNDPDVTVAHLEPERPDYFPALARILADGRGQLYVVPYKEPILGTPAPEEVPVDVYSSDGARLFAGFMPNMEWRAARDDLVYAIETGQDSGEEIVVRYRLVLPGEEER